MRKKFELDKDWLYKRHIIDNVSANDIADELGLSLQFVVRQIKKYNIPYITLEDRKFNSYMTKIPNKEWLYNELVTIAKSKIKLSKELNIPKSVLDKIIKEYDIIIPDNIILLRNITSDNLTLFEDDVWIKEHYLDKRLSCAEIAKILGITHTTVSKRIDKLGIPKFSVKDQHQRHITQEQIDKLENIEWIKDQYLNHNRSLTDIGKELGVARRLIQIRLKNVGITIRSSTIESRKHIPDESLELVEDIEWLKNEHYNKKQSIVAIANNIGVSDRTLCRVFKRHGLDPITLPSSTMEQEVAEYIKRLGFDTETNTRKYTTPLELDIYLPDKKIAIEFNGLYWHSEKRKEKNYHYKKYLKCKENGIRLIQIFEDEYEKEWELIQHKLKHILGIDNINKVYARKTKIIEVNKSDKKNFFNKYHIQGDGPSSIQYGLTYNNELVACIGFIKNTDGSYNLNRYATSCNVVGGFTKLLAHFEKEYNKPKIITFADLRWSDGDLYYKTGFVMDKLLKPDYAWVVKYNKTHYERQHKFNYRHSKMKKKLINYDPTKSEVENMHAHKFYRIYDAGKLRFIKNTE